MYVIGIGSGFKQGFSDSAAVLMKDGQMIAAAEEERFTLAKHARGELPRRSIQFCLDQAGIKIQDVDFVCSHLITYTHYTRRLEDYFKFHFNHSPAIRLYDHHHCHAASTFYASGFDESTVLCMDFSGDSSSGMIAHGKDQKIEVLQKFHRNQSLGLYYGMMTQFLGYGMTHDEYKVMGLASYGTPKYEELFDQILKTTADGFELNPLLDKRLKEAEIYTTDFSTRQERIFTDHLENILGPRRLRGSELSQHYIDMAASLQKRLETVAVHLAKIGIEKTGAKNICIAGGIGLNVKMNMEIAKAFPDVRLFVPPVPHDAGLGYGAAILCMVEHGYKIEKLSHAYWGPEYSNAQIKHTLNQIGAKYQELDNPTEQAAIDLAEGKSIGWFQGRMEYGPRALGNRSILADPRSKSVKDRINATIKYREEYRPFCPSVLFERQTEYFEDGFEAPFMAVNTIAKPGAENILPAVVHTDRTARIQSVNAQTNPKYHALITEFSKHSGVGVLLNTSLNINEQPLVNAPLEALHTYFCSGLDALYLGDFKLSK